MTTRQQYKLSWRLHRILSKADGDGSLVHIVLTLELMSPAITSAAYNNLEDRTQFHNRYNMTTFGTDRLREMRWWKPIYAKMHIRAFYKNGYRR